MTRSIKPRLTRRVNTVAIVFRGKRGWFFRVKARNGETIAASESYTRCSDAVRGAKRVAPGARVVVEAP